MRLNHIPRTPLKIPMSILFLDREAITDRAKRIIKNFSIYENFMAKSASTGVKKNKMNTLRRPPKREDTMPIFKAFSPSPF